MREALIIGGVTLFDLAVVAAAMWLGRSPSLPSEPKIPPVDEKRIRHVYRDLW